MGNEKRRGRCTGPYPRAHFLCRCIHAFFEDFYPRSPIIAFCSAKWDTRKSCVRTCIFVFSVYCLLSTLFKSTLGPCDSSFRIAQAHLRVSGLTFSVLVLKSLTGLEGLLGLALTDRSCVHESRNV